jgi:hypothetical protein
MLTSAAGSWVDMSRLGTRAGMQAMWIRWEANSMKKSALALALLGLIGLAFVAQALAAPSPKATGDVIADSGTQVFESSFNAQIQKGESKGSFHVLFTQGTLAGQFYDGTVSCYIQSGNQGSLGGFVESTNNPTISFIRITVQDNGEGSNATGPDLIRIQRFASPPPVSSRCLLPVSDLATVTGGNLQIH